MLLIVGFEPSIGSERSTGASSLKSPGVPEPIEDAERIKMPKRGGELG